MLATSLYGSRDIRKYLQAGAKMNISSFIQYQFDNKIFSYMEVNN
tara:strand:- start:14 stop:148 length:135 start_codon:yes stop_codon:yes gene_type:complete